MFQTPTHTSSRRSPPSGMRAFLLSAALLWGGAGGAAGQELRGRIIDAESTQPVVLAYVGLLAPGREFVVAALADEDGRFSVRAPQAGSYFLYVARAGYKPILDGLFELGEDGLLELSVGLTPAPIEIEPVDVAVGSRPSDLRTVGFYDRAATGLGHFITREEILRSAPEDLTDVMRGVPGLRVYEPGPSPFAPTGVRKPEVLVASAGEWCSPALYIDGIAVARGSHRRGEQAVRPDDFLDPSEVDAVEIYTRPADTPAQFEATSGCGAVVIWTRKR